MYKSQFSLSALSCPPMKKIAHRKPKKTKRVYPLRGIAISDYATVHNKLHQCFGIFHCNGIENESFRNRWNSIKWCKGLQILFSKKIHIFSFFLSFPLSFSLSFFLPLFVCLFVFIYLIIFFLIIVFRFFYSSHQILVHSNSDSPGQL